MSALRKLASQTAVYGLSTILGRFLNYLLVPLHTRIFDTAEYGVIGEMYSYVTLILVLLTHGMETAFFRFSKEENNGDRVFPAAFVSVTAISILFTALTCLFSSTVAEWIDYQGNEEYIIYFALILGFDAVAQVPFALLRQQNRSLKFAVIRNINIGISILLNLYFLLLCPWMARDHGAVLPFYDPSVGVGYVFIANLVASMITLPLLWREITEVSAGFDAAVWKRMIVYALPLVIVGLGGMVNETLDRIIMKYILPDKADAMSQVGIYSANYKLSIIITLFIQAFRFAAEPFFFSHAGKDDRRTVYARVMDYFVIVCFGMFLLVTLYIDVFKRFIGGDFHEGLHIVPVLLLANICLGIYYNVSIWYRLSDQTGKGAMISLTGAAITIVFNFWWIPLFGYTGAAWATLVCYFSMMAMCWYLGRKYYPIPYHLGHTARFAVLALGLYAIGWYVRTGPGEGRPVLVFACGTALMLIFGGAALLFVRKDKMLTSPD